MARKRQPETTLYAPVKRYLEALGFTVKGEVCGCDLVALRGDDPLMVIVAELKLGFSLDLVLQGVERTAACDEVWLAVRAASRRGRLRDPRVRKLCRFLGFGLLGVSAKTTDVAPGWFMKLGPAQWKMKTKQKIKSWRSCAWGFGP
jgi:hypothetical protein